MEKKTIKLCSWNVNGIRAVAKKGFHNWLDTVAPDVVCLQETKAQIEQLDDNLKNFTQYPVTHFNSAERKGYSGVASFFSERIKPEAIINGFEPEITQKVIQKLDIDPNLIDAFHSEGRVIHSKHSIKDQYDFSLFNIYFPNGGASEERYQFKLSFYEFFLEYLKEFQKIRASCEDL